MPNLLEAVSAQLPQDVVLHAVSNSKVNGKDDKVMLTHSLGVSREPDDAHRELNSLGYTVTRASTVTHQNVAKPGSTRQLTPQGTQTWKYNHPQGYKAEMNMRDSGGTSVMINGPRHHHERFRDRMDMKPHPEFKKMDADKAKATQDAKKPKVRVDARSDVELALSRSHLYVKAGGPGSGRHPGALKDAGFKKDNGISRRASSATQENHYQHANGAYYKVTRNVDQAGKQTDVKSWRHMSQDSKSTKGDGEASLVAHIKNTGRQGISRYETK
jgi:hypothetical protein